MEFSKELWRNILSYFHSCYKRPSHYVAIAKNKDFYILSAYNKTSVTRVPYKYLMSKETQNSNIAINKNKDLEIQGYLYGNTKDLFRYTGSYYIKMMLASNMNSENYNNRKKFIRRGVAKYANRNVYNDFVDILNHYKKNQKYMIVRELCFY